MYNLDFNNPCHVHFIGIGGISMSGLAQILMKNGFTVSGSDCNKSALTEELAASGCQCFYSQVASNISDDIDLVVYTAAIAADNEELLEAKNRSIPTIPRADLLGLLMRNYKEAINIAGTHGKTTTTSMVSEVLMACEMDPTITVGGILHSIGGNVRLGSSEVFVAEACEYTNSFLSFFPTINIILNVKADHLDFFKDLDDIRNSFKLFVERLPENGVLVINTDIENYEYFYKDKNVKVITYGSDPEKSKFSAANIAYDDFGCCSYDLLVDGKPYMNGASALRVSLSVPGDHNVYNSLSVIACCSCLGLSYERIASGLSNFTGTDRRFQKKGSFNGVNVIDDYAHHPDEIAATLSSAKHYPHNTIWTVFQPHTYTRTKALLPEFAKALSASDKVVLADIYAAREKNTIGISSKDLQKAIQDLGKECYYFGSFDEIEKFLKKNCINDDLLITMGAGDIYKVGENLVNN